MQNMALVQGRDKEGSELAVMETEGLKQAIRDMQENSDEQGPVKCKPNNDDAYVFFFYLSCSRTLRVLPSLASFVPCFVLNASFMFVVLYTAIVGKLHHSLLSVRMNQKAQERQLHAARADGIKLQAEVRSFHSPLIFPFFAYLFLCPLMYCNHAKFMCNVNALR